MAQWNQGVDYSLTKREGPTNKDLDLFIQQIMTYANKMEAAFMGLGMSLPYLILSGYKSPSERKHGYFHMRTLRCLCCDMPLRQYVLETRSFTPMPPMGPLAPKESMELKEAKLEALREKQRKRNEITQPEKIRSLGSESNTATGGIVDDLETYVLSTFDDAMDALDWTTLDKAVLGKIPPMNVNDPVKANVLVGDKKAMFSGIWEKGPNSQDWFNAQTDDLVRKKAKQIEQQISLNNLRSPEEQERRDKEIRAYLTKATPEQVGEALRLADKGVPLSLVTLGNPLSFSEFALAVQRDFSKIWADFMKEKGRKLK